MTVDGDGGGSNARFGAPGLKRQGIARERRGQMDRRRSIAYRIHSDRLLARLLSLPLLPVDSSSGWPFSVLLAALGPWALLCSCPRSAYQHSSSLSPGGHSSCSERMRRRSCLEPRRERERERKVIGKTCLGCLCLLASSTPLPLGRISSSVDYVFYLSSSGIVPVDCR